MWLSEALDYEGAIIRPPSEARSIILQVTVGCSHNRCTFCSAYRQKRFHIKERERVAADLTRAASLFSGVRRLFVADGDALVLPMPYWQWLLPAIHERLPAVQRVGAYTTARAVRKKTDAELQWLREHGLRIVYLGVESGDDETLRYVCKESNAAQLLDAGRRLQAAGITVSVTVLLGIAPAGRSAEHARRTGQLLSAMDPPFVGALSVMLCAGSPLAEQVRQGTHTLPGPTGYLRELREMFAHTTLSDGQFMANHASNYLPLKVHLPEGQAAALALIDRALAGEVSLKPEELRAL